jgi:apolipoprotein N-acyltransferase
MFAALFWIIQRTRGLTKTFSVGLCFGIGYFASTLYWVAESFKCVGLGNYGYIAVSLLVLYLALYPATACVLTKMFATTRLNFLLFFTSFWILTEYLRGVVFTGFPWNLIGYATYDLEYFPQIADTLGIYGVSFIFLLIVSLLTYCRTAICGLLLYIFTTLYGYYKVNCYDGYVKPDDQNFVTIVQPSITQESKMDVKQLKNNIDKHIQLSCISNIYSKKQLIIWPEGAVNIPITSPNNVLNYISSTLKYDDCFIISGCDRIDEMRRLYNCVCAIGRDNRIAKIYDKRHLLPFGEFIPEILLKCGLRKVTPGIVNFSSGHSKKTFQLDGFQKFDVAICYEISFPGEVLDDQGSSWILNVTNDSWFKNSDGPTQHLRTACFRAIEEGKAIVRCANNGISCVIDCNGQILKKLETNEVGRMATTMPKKWQLTIFSVHKNKIVILVVCTLLILLLCVRNRRAKIK